MPTRSALIAVAAAFLAVPVPVQADEPAGDHIVPLFDAAGYRIARYRSPILRDPLPAQRMPLSEALALDPDKDALFLDVMPAEGGRRDPVSGAWALGSAHLSIPGAQWHPEAGRVPADDDLWQAFETAARSIAPARPVIVFCRIDCWMSWNAAKRLVERGIGNVWWLAEGTDGWHAAGRTLAPAVPVIAPASPINNKED